MDPSKIEKVILDNVNDLINEIDQLREELEELKTTTNQNEKDFLDDIADLKNEIEELKLYNGDLSNMLEEKDKIIKQLNLEVNVFTYLNNI
jgi:prefoldin subunit 5